MRWLLFVIVVVAAICLIYVFMRSPAPVNQTIQNVEISAPPNEARPDHVESTQTPPIRSPKIVKVESTPTVSPNQTGNAQVSGIVVDRHGAPQVATIFLFLNGDGRKSARTKSNDDGSFELTNLAAGEYTVHLGPPKGLLRDVVDADPITLRDGEVRKGLRLVYDENSLLRISGYVTDPDGHPVQHANVMASGENTRPDSTMSEEDGSFLLLGLSDANYHLTVFHRNYSRATMEEVPAGATGLSIQLQPIGSDQAALTGRVVEASTRMPIPKFEIALDSPFSLQTAEGMARVRMTPFENPEGQFRLTSYPKKGVPVVLIAKADGYQPATYYIEEISNTDSITGIELALKLAACSIDGTVYDSAGKPVVDALISVEFESELEFFQGLHVPQSKTDQYGAFKLNSLGASNTKLLVTSKAYSPAYIDVLPQPDHVVHVEIIVEGLGTALGIVTYEGKAVEGAQVFPRDLPRKLARTDADGRYKIEGLPVGELELRAILPPINGNDTRLENNIIAEIASDQETLADIELIAVIKTQEDVGEQ